MTFVIVVGLIIGSATACDRHTPPTAGVSPDAPLLTGKRLEVIAQRELAITGENAARYNEALGDRKPQPRAGVIAVSDDGTIVTMIYEFAPCANAKTPVQVTGALAASKITVQLLTHVPEGTLCYDVLRIGEMEVRLPEAGGGRPIEVFSVTRGK